MDICIIKFSLCSVHGYYMLFLMSGLAYFVMGACKPRYIENLNVIRSFSIFKAFNCLLMILTESIHNL